MKYNDDEIKAEVAAVLADRERLAQKQREARHSRLNDPARAEEVEKARAALIFEHGIIRTVHKIVGEGSFLSRYYAEAKISLTRFRRGGRAKISTGYPL